MDLLHPLSNGFCLRLVTTLAHFLWQAAAVALLAGLAGVFLRKSQAAVRYWVFVGALGVMAVCPAATFPLVHGSSSHISLVNTGAPLLVTPQNESPEGSAAVAAVPGRTSVEPSLGWKKLCPFIVSGYLLGVSLMLVRLLIGLRSGHRLRLASQPVTESSVLRMLAEHSRAFGLRFVPAAAYCQRVASPIVVGVLRPVILLPMFLATGLSIEQIEAILAHELAHIRRHDPLINLIQRVIETFLFFHPAVWWVSRCIRLERENSCDDAAMSAGMERHTYAQSLLHMAQRSLANDMERRRQVGIALTAGNASQLRSRIIRLLQGPEEVVRLSRSWPIAITVAALIAGVLIPLSVTCATQPAWQTANSMARRDELLAQADAQIRHGLVELAAWYPELSADDGIGWENINTPSETGQLNISLFHFHIKGRHTRNKVPEGVVVDLSVILHPSDGLPDQMDSVKLLNWGLAGQIRIDAADPQLKKAMRDLVEKSLAPLFNGHP